MPNRFCLTLVTVGSLSVHLDQNPSLNVAGPGEGPFGPRRPFPNEPAVIAADNGSTATYHAFTIKVKKEFDKGLFLAHYTESKSIDNNSSQLSDLQDHNDIRSNKGLSGHHVPHRFVATTLYDLPFGRGKKYLASSGGVVNALLGGWSVNGIYTLQSGSSSRRPRAATLPTPSVGVAGQIGWETVISLRVNGPA